MTIELPAEDDGNPFPLNIASHAHAASCNDRKGRNVLCFICAREAGRFKGMHARCWALSCNITPRTGVHWTHLVYTHPKQWGMVPTGMHACKTLAFLLFSSSKKTVQAPAGGGGGKDLTFATGGAVDPPPAEPAVVNPLAFEPLLEDKEAEELAKADAATLLALTAELEAAVAAVLKSPRCAADAAADACTHWSRARKGLT